MADSPLWLGGCSQNTRKNVARPAYQNVTKVYDYSLTPDPGGIDPYPRFHNPPGCGTPACAPNDCVTCCADTPGDPCCELPLPTDFIPPYPGSIGYFDGAYWNTYISTSMSHSFQQACRDSGFKAVFAKKQHYGRPGMKSRIWGEIGNPQVTDMPDTMSACCGECRFHGDDTDYYDTTKYLSLFARCDGTFTNVVGGAVNTAVAICSHSIDRYSGVSTGTNFSSSTSVSGGFAEFCFGELNDANNDIRLIVTRYTEFFNQFYFVLFQRAPDICSQSGPNTFSSTWDNGDGTVGVCSISVDGGTTDMSYYVGGVQQYSAAYTVTNTTMTKHTTLDVPQTVADNYTYDITMTSVISDVYTAEEAYQDAIDTINLFPLDDDVIYPWRQDAFVTRGPQTGYDEIDGRDGLNNIQQPTVPFQEVFSSSIYSGHPVGLPNVYGIDGGWWYAKFENWEQCDDLSCGQGNPECEGTWYIRSYGRWNYDTVGIPLTATRWTNLYEEENVWPQYGSVRYFGDAVYISKYAEIRMNRPSEQWNRWCGNDRFQLTSSAYCITGSTTSSVTVDSYLSILPAITAGQTSSICGTGVCDGIWEIASVSSYNITLGKLFVSASSLTTPPIDDCGTGMISLLRFQHGEAYPICGTASLSSITNATPITCSTTDVNYLINGDNVSILSASGVTNANGNWSVEVIDSHRFILSGSAQSGSATYTGGGFVRSNPTNDPSGIWTAHGPKRSYCYKEWLMNWRDIGEDTRLRTQAFWITNGEVDCDGNPCPNYPTSSTPLRYNQTLWGMLPEIYGIYPTCNQFTADFTACKQYVMAVVPESSFSGSYSLDIISGSVTQSRTITFTGSIDTFTNGHTFTFPPQSAMGFDLVYGGMLFKGQISQDQVDVFETPWLTPCPCEELTDVIGEDTVAYFGQIPCQYDNCSCQEDTINIADDTLENKIYPAKRLVECVCNTPSGSPALPSGIYVGCLPSDTVDSINPPQGNVCNYGGVGEIVNTPWICWNLQHICVCSGSGGRFKDIYGKDGIVCR